MLCICHNMLCLALLLTNQAFVLSNAFSRSFLGSFPRKTYFLFLLIVELLSSYDNAPLSPSGLQYAWSFPLKPSPSFQPLVTSLRLASWTMFTLSSRHLSASHVFTSSFLDFLVLFVFTTSVIHSWQTIFPIYIMWFFNTHLLFFFTKEFLPPFDHLHPSNVISHEY